MAGFNATSRSFLKLWPILLVAGIVAVTLALTSSAQAAGREPGAPAFDSSGYLHVEYGCDYYAHGIMAMQSQPWLGGGLTVTTDFYLRRASTWLSCSMTAQAPSGHACYGVYEVGGVDYAISGWTRTSFRCQ